MKHLGESGKLMWHFIVGFRHLHRRVGFQDLPQYIQAHPHISCHLSSYSVIYPQNFSTWKLEELFWHKCLDTSEDEIFQVLSLVFVQDLMSISIGWRCFTLCSLLDILWDRWSECSLVISHISCVSDLISLLSIANLSSISVKKTVTLYRR